MEFSVKVILEEFVFQETKRKNVGFETFLSQKCVF